MKPEEVERRVRSTGDLKILSDALLLPKSPVPTAEVVNKHVDLIDRKNANVFDSERDERWFRSLLADLLCEFVRGERSEDTKYRGGQRARPIYAVDFVERGEEFVRRSVRNAMRGVNSHQLVDADFNNAWQELAEWIAARLAEESVSESEKSVLSALVLEMTPKLREDIQQDAFDAKFMVKKSDLEKRRDPEQALDHLFGLSKENRNQKADGTKIEAFPSLFIQYMSDEISEHGDQIARPEDVVKAALLTLSDAPAPPRDGDAKNIAQAQQAWLKTRFDSMSDEEKRRLFEVVIAGQAGHVSGDWATINREMRFRRPTRERAETILAETSGKLWRHRWERVRLLGKRASLAALPESKRRRALLGKTTTPDIFEHARLLGTVAMKLSVLRSDDDRRNGVSGPSLKSLLSIVSKLESIKLHAFPQSSSGEWRAAVKLFDGGYGDDPITTFTLLQAAAPSHLRLPPKDAFPFVRKPEAMKEALPDMARDLVRLVARSDFWLRNAELPPSAYGRVLLVAMLSNEHINMPRASQGYVFDLCERYRLPLAKAG